ncbi:MAG: LacI family DNA-binding transcriptional regulator [Clostridia bacterium]|nr:LacI family DNA-binding transcriptional regulator [Clostridia bacterium]
MKIYTIKDIARLAGVSVTTVSRVLNRRPDVNRETREKVERVMAECHFVGNANARGLKQTDSDVVAVILRGRHNPFLTSLAEAIMHYSQGSGTSFLMEFIDEQDDEFQTALRLTHEKRVKAFIFVGSRIDDRCKVLLGMDIPMVFATAAVGHEQLARASAVTIDERAMARLAVKHLLDCGHERIAVFGASRTEGDNLSLRYQGALDAFREKGLVFDESRYVETRFSMEGAYECAREFFLRRPDTTAAFCMSDSVAMGLIRALKDLGRTVPDDVSVFGFDGTEMGQFFIPRLCTVEQPVDDIARESVRVLMDMFRNNAEPTEVVVKAELKLRESVK